MVPMQSFVLLRGGTDQSIDVFIADSTTGGAKTGLVAAGGACFYRRGPVGAVIPLALTNTMTSTGSHVDGGFIEIQSVNMPGLYRLGLTDGACAAGVNTVELMLQFSGAHPVRAHIDLIDYDAWGATTTPAQIAEALLKYDLSTISGEAARSMLNAMRLMRNKWTVSGGQLIVTKEDDATEAWRADLTTVANAEAITASDPTT